MDPAFLFADRPDDVHRVREALDSEGEERGWCQLVASWAHTATCRGASGWLAGSRGPGATRGSSSAASRPPMPTPPPASATPSGIPDGWVLDEAWLRVASGLCASGSIDPELTALLTGCDGSRRLGEVIHLLGEALDTDPGELARQVVPIVHQLVERGYLVPPAPAAEAPGDQ